MQLTNEYFYKLKNAVPLFRGFSNDDLQKILKLSVIKLYKKNTRIFNERDHGDSMFIVVKGKVNIIKKITKEFDEVLASLEQGQIFGEMSIVDNALRSAAAVVSEDDTLIIEITKTVIRSNANIAFKFYQNFATILAERLRKTNESLIEVTQTKIDLEVRFKSFIKNKTDKVSDMSHSNFKKADMSGMFLDKVNLSNSVFTGANLGEVRMKACTFGNSVWSGSDIEMSVFENCDFREAQMINTTFQKTIFKNCVFNDVKLSQTLSATTEGKNKQSESEAN